MEQIASEEMILQLKKENKELGRKIDELQERIRQLGLINEDMYAKYMHASNRIAAYENQEPQYRRI